MTDSGIEPDTRFVSWMAADFSMRLQPDMLLRIAPPLFLFMASAFFSGAEAALFWQARMHLRLR